VDCQRLEPAALVVHHSGVGARASIRTPFAQRIAGRLHWIASPDGEREAGRDQRESLRRQFAASRAGWVPGDGSSVRRAWALLVY